MKISLRDIHENEQDLHFTQADSWVTKSLSPLHEDASLLPPESPVDVSLTLRKVDELYLAEGAIQAALGLLCSRCGEAFPFPVRTRFHALYSPEEEITKMPGLEKGDSSPRKTRTGRAFSNAGEHDTDYEITHLSENELDLGDVIQEQVRLATPFRPLCKEHEDATESSADAPGLQTTPAPVTTHRPFAALAERLGTRKK